MPPHLYVYAGFFAAAPNGESVTVDLNVMGEVQTITLQYQEEKMKRLLNTLLVISLALCVSLGLGGCGTQPGTSEPEPESESTAEEPTDEAESAASGDVIDNSDTEEEGTELQPVSVGETFTVPDMFEITLHDAEWSDSVYSHYSAGFDITYAEDEPDSTYLVVNATVKNIGSKTEDFGIGLYSSGYLGAGFRINDKYEIDAYGAAMLTDGVSSSGEIEPMKTAEVKFYASVSDEIKDSFEGLELFLAARQPADDGVWYLGDDPVGLYVATFE